MLLRYDLAAEDPRMLSVLRSFAPIFAPAPPEGAHSYWKISGPGVVALKGGVWESGVVFGPEFAIATESRVLAVSCLWDPDRLGEWEKNSLVRLLLFDTERRCSWVIDVTHTNQTAMIVPAAATISANCVIILQLRAGNRSGTLRRPPYIRTASVVVHYRY
jgi:hypothetical protein